MGKHELEIIQPEFEIDVKPVKDKTKVRIYDLTKGELINQKEYTLDTGSVIKMMRQKLSEIL